MTRKTLLLDADVVIDFGNSDSTILEHVPTTLGRVVVLQGTLDEVDASPEDVTPLGIDIVEEPTELLTQASGPIAGTSLQDRLCMHACQKYGWTCVTNDQKLQRECKALNVATIYGLRLIIDLVAAGVVTAAHAREVAYRIHRSNPHHINDKVMRRFEDHLRNLG